MKTGQSVTDSQGTTWTVGQELGRGGYARAFVARSATGREAVLKVSLEAADLFGDDADVLAQACAAILREQAGLHREHARPWLPELLGELALPGGGAGLLIPRYPGTLATRLRAGAPLASLLTTLSRAAGLASAATHGNLRPENILLGDDGRVVFADPLTPTWIAQQPRLAARLGDRAPARAPEAAGDPTGACDAWALCVALYQATLAAPAGPDARREELPRPPRDGLDKSALARIKDRVLARLDAEGANPRFAPRVADRLCALLNRGLSQLASPSPPYRFATVHDLHVRLQELVDLIEPRVVSVGKVLLAPAARDGVFAEGLKASFSTTVTCTDGMTHEDLAAGLLVRDLDAEGDDRVPVPEASFSVRPHPSGRLRFDFQLPELRPGRYTVRVAFAVKDSNATPVTTDGHFELRAPPGYIPPADDPPAPTAAIPFPGVAAGRPRLGLDQPRFTPADDDDAPDPFPTPIAPSDPGTLDDLDDGPPPVLRAGPATDPRADERPGVSARAPATAPKAPPPKPVAQVSGRSAATDAPPPIPSIRPTAPSLDDLDDGGPNDRTAESPRPSRPPSPAPAPRQPSPTLAPVPSGRAWDSPGTWEELPSPDLGRDPLDLGFDPPLADLPPIDEGAPASSGALTAARRALDAIRDNPWIAMIGLVAALVGLLVITGILFQSCGS